MPLLIPAVMIRHSVMNGTVRTKTTFRGSVLESAFRHSPAGLRHPAIAFSSPPERGALERRFLLAELRTECDRSQPEPGRPIQMRVHLSARFAETCCWISRSGEPADRKKRKLERISSSEVLYLLSERKSKKLDRRCGLLLSIHDVQCRPQRSSVDFFAQNQSKPYKRV